MYITVLPKVKNVTARFRFRSTPICLRSSRLVFPPSMLQRFERGPVPDLRISGQQLLVGCPGTLLPPSLPRYGEIALTPTQRFHRRPTSLRIPRQQAAQNIHRFGRRIGEEFPLDVVRSAGGGRLPSPTDQVGAAHGGESGHVVGTGGTEELDDECELVYWRFAGQARLALEELGEHQARGPYVDRGGVMLRAKEYLGGPIPDCNHAGS